MKYLAGWWFGTWIVFSISYMGCHPSHWLSLHHFSRWCTTNQHEIPTMWGPRLICKLVNITPITMVYGTQITIVTGAFVNQRSHHNGGPHIVETAGSIMSGWCSKVTIMFLRSLLQAATRELPSGVIKGFFENTPFIEMCSIKTIDFIEDLPLPCLKIPEATVRSEKIPCLTIKSCSFPNFGRELKNHGCPWVSWKC